VLDDQIKTYRPNVADACSAASASALPAPRRLLKSDPSRPCQTFSDSSLTVASYIKISPAPMVVRSLGHDNVDMPPVLAARLFFHRTP
jgi:hypothetical protein